MFGKSSDRLSEIKRVASHATKPSARGRIDLLPEWAQEPEAYYNSLLERYESLCAQREVVQEELSGIKLRLRQTLPHKEYQFLQERQRGLAARFDILQKEASEYRGAVRAAAEKSWATTFYHFARIGLDRDVFLKLCESTEAALGRVTVPIKGGQAEMTDEQRERWQRKTKLQERRHKFRMSHEVERATVYSDEKGGDLRSHDQIVKHEIAAKLATKFHVRT